MTPSGSLFMGQSHLFPKGSFAFFLPVLRSHTARKGRILGILGALRNGWFLFSLLPAQQKKPGELRYFYLAFSGLVLFYVTIFSFASFRIIDLVLLHRHLSPQDTLCSMQSADYILRLPRPDPAPHRQNRVLLLTLIPLFPDRFL